MWSIFFMRNNLVYNFRPDCRERVHYVNLSQILTCVKFSWFSRVTLRMNNDLHDKLIMYYRLNIHSWLPGCPRLESHLFFFPLQRDHLLLLNKSVCSNFTNENNMGSVSFIPSDLTCLEPDLVKSQGPHSGPDQVCQLEIPQIVYWFPFVHGANID